MELSQLTAYAQLKFHMREQRPWPDFPGFSVLADPVTGKWAALLMRQWDSDSGEEIQRCDMRCGQQVLAQRPAPFLSKPFRIAELRARVAAHLRRETRAPAAYVRRGGVSFDMPGKAAFCADTPVKFTKSEYAICEFLALHAGQTFSREQIYEAVFGFDGTADDSAVAEHVKNIRAKLRAFGLSPIETVWGVGYKWKSE